MKQRARTTGCPLVSVVLPTRNRVDLMSRAVTSVLAQSEEDLELIVIDDASEDGTGEYIAAVARQDSRVSVVRNATPQGGAGARNEGIAVSSGKWIGFLDDDDEWMPTKLQHQLRKLDSEPDAVACSCSYIVSSPAGSTRIMHVPQSVTLRQLLTRNCLGGASMCLCSHAVLKDIGGFDRKFVSGQDFDLWVRLRQKGNVVTCDEPLVVHRAHDGPRITSNMRAQYLGARHFHFKHRNLMDTPQRRHWISFTCFMMSRQTSRALRYRLRYLLLSLRNSSPRLLLAYVKGSLPRLLRDALRAIVAPRSPAIPEAGDR
jgi:glycosyltransferase involved in cell wall biosynthesis